MAIGVLICFVGAMRHGFGKHILAIPPQDIGPLFHWIWWYSILIVVAVSLIKLSIGFFLLRLAQRTQYRRFLYGVISKSTSNIHVFPERRSDNGSIFGLFYALMCRDTRLPVCPGKCSMEFLLEASAIRYRNCKMFLEQNLYSHWPIQQLSAQL